MHRILAKLITSKTSLAGLGSVTTGFIFLLVVMTQIELNLPIAIVIGASWTLYLIFQFLQAYYSADEKKSEEIKNETNSFEDDYAKTADIAVYPEEEYVPSPELIAQPEVIPKEPLTWREKHGVPYVYVPGAGAAEIARNAKADFDKTLAANLRVDRKLAAAGIKQNDAYSQGMKNYFANK